jgi:hypothetical protein
LHIAVYQSKEIPLGFAQCEFLFHVNFRVEPAIVGKEETENEMKQT